VALDGTRAQQRPRNKWWTSAGGGGALGSCRQSEREGEGGEQGAGLKRGAEARTWMENARLWARPRRGDRGREVRDGLTGGDGGTERERERVRARETTPIGLAHGTEREGEE
jgi:hypothetical protein